MDTELGARPLEGAHMLTHKQRRASHSITLVHTPSPPHPPLSVLNIYSPYTVSGHTQTSWSPCSLFCRILLKKLHLLLHTSRERCTPPGDIVHPMPKSLDKTVRSYCCWVNRQLSPYTQSSGQLTLCLCYSSGWEVLLRHCLLHCQGHRPDGRQLSKPVRWNTIHSHGSSHVV